MALNCRITRNEEGKIEDVLAPNNKKSILYNSLLSFYNGDENQALTAYALTETEEIKRMMSYEKVKHLNKISNLENGTRINRLSQTEEQGRIRAGEIATDATNYLTGSEGASKKSAVQDDQIENYGTLENLKDFKEGVDFVQEVAEDYKKFKNIKGLSHPKVTTIYSEISKEIAEIYEQSEASSNKQDVVNAYKALEDETLEQYNFIVEKGLKVERWLGQGEPYVNSKEMLKDLKDNKHLYFLPNSEAFGSDINNTEGRIGLKKTDISLADGYSMTLSEVFRVVHDYFGHGILGNQFGAIGEENATLQHLDLYTQEALPAVIFQTRGQNSWVNFSGINEDALSKMKEARQKNDSVLLEEAQKMFTFAEPKDNILPNKYNFKKYETARRIKEQREIEQQENYFDPRGEYGDNEISKLLQSSTKNSRSTRGVNRKSVQGTRNIRLYELNVVAEYTLDSKIENEIKKAFSRYLGNQKILEISDGQSFREMMIESLKDNPFKSSVTIHSAEEFSNMRMFITEDGSTGITLTKDGFLGGAWSDPNFTRPNNLSQLLILGIKEGAVIAEAFDTVLPDMYSNYGLKAVSRVEFNDDYRPLVKNGALEDWNYDKYKKFNNGRPDVVFFIYDGGSRDNIEERLGQFDLYNSYQKEETESFDNTSYDKAYRFMEIEAVNRYNFEQKSNPINFSKTEEISTPKTTIQSRPYKGGRNFAIISDNKEVGRLKTVDYNGGLKITGVQVDEAERGKGITSNAYLNVVKQLSKEGVILYSDDVRAPQTEKIWQNLLEQGVTEKTKEGNYKTVIFPSGYDANGEVNKEKLLKYAQSTDRKIQVKEKATVRNTLLATNLNSSKELVKKVKEAVIKNGLFMFDKRQMINSGLYNDYEASVILNTPVLQESIKQMYNALSNSEEITVDVEGYSTEDFIVPISDELNTFGKRVVSNPYMKEKELHSLLADETDVDGTMTDGEFEQSYKKNREFKKLANDIAKNVKTVSVKEITEDGVLEDKIEGSTLPILEKTLIDGYNEEFSNKLKTLKSISDTVWKASSKELKIISTQMTKAVINNGINLKGLPNIIGIRKREDTLDLLTSLERMINFSTDVNKNVYSQISDNYFRRNEKKKDYVVTDDSRDFVLENSPLSEYELFSRYKIVRSRGNIYREVVSDTNLEDMYVNSLGSNQLPNDLAEAKDYIKGVVAKVDISDDNVETEELEKMMLYKNYFNFPLEIKDNTKSFSRIAEFKGDLEYSLDTFVKDFNKYLLETNNTLFKVTENGIEFINDDVLSKQDALESLDDSILEELQNHSLVSTSISLDFENKDVDTEPQQKDRDMAINNPKAVKKAMGEYIYDDSNNILVLRGATDTFVRTNKGLYELVYETPSLGIYGKLPTLESTPILGEKKPAIKSRDYTYLENKVSIFTEVNSTLSKAEKESINNEFFNCQK